MCLQRFLLNIWWKMGSALHHNFICGIIRAGNILISDAISHLTNTKTNTHHQLTHHSVWSPTSPSSSSSSQSSSSLSSPPSFCHNWMTCADESSPSNFLMLPLLTQEEDEYFCFHILLFIASPLLQGSTESNLTTKWGFGFRFFWALQSCPKDSWPLRPVVRAISRHYQQEDILKDIDNNRDKNVMIVLSLVFWQQGWVILL